MTSCFFENEKLKALSQLPVYNGTDLGLTYTPEKSTFRVWSPDADMMVVNFYKDGLESESYLVESMERDTLGTWLLEVGGDLEGKFYTFQTFINEGWSSPVPDPYAKAVGTNGKRAMVIDLKKTNPEGWENDQKPPLNNPTDIIIYELHIRDLSVAENSGIQQKGKFLGLTELGTTNQEGLSTGLDHIKELGVTHIHLLPSYDFMSIDESKLEEQKFNWGYDPQNYNVPEGSYSTNPADGRVRIREFKQLIKTLHENGLRVIMDVVYNHTGVTGESNFNQLFPEYYYRMNSNGSFSDASACGNETASEKPMMRKFMIESTKFWAEEYHIDGFRFDLMGIHDIETMNKISESLHAVDSTIFIYGEGWTAGGSPLKETKRALKKYTYKLDNVAAFSDDMRDGVKGHVFTAEDRGFASGNPKLKESVKFGIVAATEHPQIDYEAVNYSKWAWANEPSQCINYVSCHDNHTLYDRLVNSNPKEPEAELIKMHKLANTIILTSQGISFLHAGVEMLRTKQGVENSYNSPDSINQLDWSRKTQYPEVFDYYKKLIALRKNHPAFRMPSKAMIQKHLSFFEIPDSNLIGYQISDHANGDQWETILVYFNGNKESRQIEIPKGNWKIVVQDGIIDENGLGQNSGGAYKISGRSALIFTKN
jgi:pullulanase